jgi:hypothetical protein
MRAEQGQESYRELVNRAVKELKPYLSEPREERKERLYSLCREIEAEQNEFKKIGWNRVRMLKSRDLVVVEESLKISCQGLRGTDLGLSGCKRLCRAKRRSIWEGVATKFCSDG